jgi:hypothetical protein
MWVEKVLAMKEQMNHGLDAMWCSITWEVAIFLTTNQKN